MPTIAPWLIPADALRAAQGGTSAGLEYRGQNIAAEENAASLAQAAQKVQSAHDLEQQKITGGLAEAKARTDIEAQLAARKFAAQQSYQNAINGGEDPIKSLLQFGPQMGDITSGVGQLALEQFKAKQAAMVPTPVFDPANPSQVRGYAYGGTFHPVPLPKTEKSTIPDSLKLRLDSIQKDKALYAGLMDKGDPRKADEYWEMFQEKEKQEREIYDRYAQPEGDAQPSTKASLPPNIADPNAPKTFIGTPGGVNKFDPYATGEGPRYQPPQANPGQQPGPSQQDDPLGLFNK
jgi:hypothetical protein